MTNLTNESLLDKIFRTPEGEVLEITPAEDMAIWQTLWKHFPCSEAFMKQAGSGEYPLLGRTMRVNYRQRD